MVNQCISILSSVLTYVCPAVHPMGNIVWFMLYPDIEVDMTQVNTSTL